MKKISTYILTLIFAIGLLFIWFPRPTIVYFCPGSNTAPDFLASPFIYKSPSQMHSLGYDFYLLGTIGNIIVWTILVLLVRLALKKTILRQETKQKKRVYNIIKYSLAFLFIVSTIVSVIATCKSIKLKADFESNFSSPSSTYTNKFTFRE